MDIRGQLVHSSCFIDPKRESLQIIEMTCPKAHSKVLEKLGLESRTWGFWARFTSALWIFEAANLWMDFRISINLLNLYVKNF